MSWTSLREIEEGKNHALRFSNLRHCRYHYGAGKEILQLCWVWNAARLNL